MCADSKKDPSIASMTGFGQATLDQGHDRYVAEARSINSRYSETRIFGLREDFALEFELGKLIKQMFERGKFDLTLRKETNEKASESNNEKKIKAHFQNLKKLQKSIGIQGEISLETVLKTLPNEKDTSKNDSGSKDFYLKVATKALQSLALSRQKEGKILVADIHKRHNQIKDWFRKIEFEVPKIREKRKSDVAAKINAAVQDLPVDAKRIEAEIALMIEKADVTEEIVRFKKHLQSFENILEAGSKKNSVGKELDFTLQEMHREINTLGAKIGEVELSRIVVNIKSEMEKIREQVQNIE